MAKKVVNPEREARLKREYEEWLSGVTIVPGGAEEIKKDLIEELNFLCKMSAEEYTLYRKWQEIQLRYPPKTSKKVNPFFDTGTNDSGYPELTEMKNNLWMPESPEDYMKLEPEVEWTMVGTKKEVQKKTKTWSMLRTFTSTMLNNSNIGRNLRFIIKDAATGKYLGVICASSDFMDLTPRDSYIGWTREVKTTQKMINHTSIGSSIVPTQPLGYNFVGGKLLGLLTLSSVIENAWDSRYKDKLVAMTTTSLYGSFSQYNGLKFWNKRGHSAGSIKFEPSKKTVLRIRDWLRNNHSLRYWEWYHAQNDQNMPLKRDHKQRSLAFAYRQLEISKELYETSHERGIYFCPLFTNSCEFLRKEIGKDDLVRRFSNSVEELVDLWKTKYAKKRVEKLVKDKKYNTTSLFYNDLIGVSWDEAKEKYLKDVGR